MAGKEYIIKKAAGGEQAPLMLAKFDSVWSDAARRAMPVKLGDLDTPEILYEREPEVEELEEEGKAAVQRTEERVRRGILSRARKSRRGWRWVLRDRERVEAERSKVAEAKERGQAIHDIHGIPLDKGVQFLGKKEGLTKLASSSTKLLPSGKQAKYEQASDNARGRYAVMMQTGPNEVTMAPLGEWWTFRALKAQSGASLGTGGHSSLVGGAGEDQGRLGRMRAKLLAKRDALAQQANGMLEGESKGGGISSGRGGKRGKRDRAVEEDEGRYDGADHLGLTMEDGDDAMAVEGRGEDGLDLADTNRSDDEGFQDGKGDEETLDANNARWSIDVSESEDEVVEEDTAKGAKGEKEDAANGVNDQLEDEGPQEVQRDQGGLSEDAKKLMQQGTTEAVGGKKRPREEAPAAAKPAPSLGGIDKRPRVSVPTGLPAAPNVAASTAPPAAKVADSSAITEKNVRDVLQLANGRMEIKAFYKRFKKATKQSARGKEDLKAILQRIVRIEESPVEGRMLVLKGYRA